MEDIKVKDHMNSPVHAIQSDKTIRQAASVMKRHDFGSLLVVHKGQLGMLTERDLVHALAEFGENETLKAHVTFPLIKIHQDKDVKEAMKLMISKNIRRLAVTGDSEKIEGIINMRDIVHVLHKTFD